MRSLALLYRVRDFILSRRRWCHDIEILTKNFNRLAPEFGGDLRRGLLVQALVERIGDEQTIQYR